jgi:hypothetical protein
MMTLLKQDNQVLALTMHCYPHHYLIVPDFIQLMLQAYVDAK